MTGDRKETAISIGLSCRLISESMNLVSKIRNVGACRSISTDSLRTTFLVQVIVDEDSSKGTLEFLEKRLFAIKNQRKAGDLEELAMVIDGKSLTYALEHGTSKVFLELALMCGVSLHIGVPRASQIN